MEHLYASSRLTFPLHFTRLPHGSASWLLKRTDLFPLGQKLLSPANKKKNVRLCIKCEDRITNGRQEAEGHSLIYSTAQNALHSMYINPHCLVRAKQAVQVELHL